VQDRTALWIRAGLRDLYGTAHREVLYRAFCRFVHDRSIGITGPLRWNEDTGEVQRRHQPDRPVSTAEWAQLADWAAFDPCAAALLRAQDALVTAATQLHRVGEHAEVDQTDPTAPTLILTPEVVLRVLQPQIRRRLATPAGDQVDADAAVILTGVGKPGSTPQRDQAILDAIHRGQDPWLTAMRCDGAGEPSEDEPEAQHSHPHGPRVPLPVAPLVLAVLTAGGVAAGGHAPVVDATAHRITGGAAVFAATPPRPPAERPPVVVSGSLQPGSTGVEVHELQRVLNAWYPQLEPLAQDGIYGPKTQTRVRYLQQRAGLEVDGIADPRTLAVLNLPPAAALDLDDAPPGAQQPDTAQDSAAADTVDVVDVVDDPPAAPRAVVLPASGQLTFGFGPRWGSAHHGIDIANEIGTPIVSAAAGVVVESGPATGFGLWVRVEHDDGTVSVYGHINEALVDQDQRVDAGQQIATMGNRGQSTGPHLHFEIWLPSGERTDPASWLREHGVSP